MSGREKWYRDAIHKGWHVDVSEWVDVAVRAVMDVADAELALPKHQRDELARMFGDLLRHLGVSLTDSPDLLDLLYGYYSALAAYPKSGGEESVLVYTGWRGYEDGSRSPVERWVRASDGDWVSLDSERRTSGDIILEPVKGDS